MPETLPGNCPFRATLTNANRIGVGDPAASNDIVTRLRAALDRALVIHPLDQEAEFHVCLTIVSTKEPPGPRDHGAASPEVEEIISTQPDFLPDPDE